MSWDYNDSEKGLSLIIGNKPYTSYIYIYIILYTVDFSLNNFCLPKYPSGVIMEYIIIIPTHLAPVLGCENAIGVRKNRSVSSILSVVIKTWEKPVVCQQRQKPDSVTFLTA